MLRRASHPTLGLLFLCLTAGCSSRAPESPGNESLHSVLWTQHAPEFRALVRQSYLLAEALLEDALADPDWSAALEQEEGYQDLPPAVILDIDETVLDNSPYQARLVRSGATFDNETWAAWCLEERATALPGALEFTQKAEELSVTVFYVTNRRHPVEAATRDNLKKVGFRLPSDRDTVLSRDERDAWRTSDKTPRRSKVAEEFRVLLLIGDNFGDFLAGGDTSPAERQKLADQYADRWGRQWIILPNPQYGSWEGSLFGFDFGLSNAERLQRKRDALRVN